MNDLERLKQAEEAEHRAVLVIDKMRVECLGCPLCVENEYPGGTPYLCTGRYDEHGLKDLDVNIFDEKPDDCPLQPAIGIIEPDAHVRYFVEDKE